MQTDVIGSKHDSTESEAFQTQFCVLLDRFAIVFVLQYEVMISIRCGTVRINEGNRFLDLDCAALAVSASVFLFLRTFF